MIYVCFRRNHEFSVETECDDNIGKSGNKGGSQRMKTVLRSIRGNKKLIGCSDITIDVRVIIIFVIIYYYYYSILKSYYFF